MKLRSRATVLALLASGIAMMVFAAIAVISHSGAPLLVDAQPINGATETHNDPRLAAARGETPPSPTEIAQWKEERQDRRRNRDEWLEQLHYCSPETDWRAIENANRQAASLQRFGEINRGARTHNWAEIGSANLAGRTHAAAPSGDGQYLYVGSDRGGVWKGTIEGQDWQPISDGLGLGSHMLLVVPPGDGPEEPQVIFTLTFDTDQLFISTDDGLTWFVPEGMPDDLYGNIRVLNDAADPRTVYFLSLARVWTGPSTYDYGRLLFRSRDGGLTFEYVYMFTVSAGADMWIDRVNGGDLYVVSHRTLYVSHNQGDSFSEVGTVSTASAAGIILAGSEAGAPTLYCARGEGGQWKLYRSLDGGLNWSFRHNIDDFWETMNCSITNPDLVYYAGVECWRSTNGGGSFNRINPWGEYYDDPEHKLHADNPGLDIYWINGQEVHFFNTDGGTYVSYDLGSTVQNLSMWGLGISQYYDVFTSATDPYLIAAGAQDQGYQQSEPDRRDPNLYFEQLISGDYGHLTSATRDHYWLYSVYPGFVLLQKNEHDPPSLHTIDFPNATHSWMPPIVADPSDTEAFYFCADHLWRYERQGFGYVYAMTELPQEFTGSSYATALAFSPADPDYWYVATNNGHLWHSHNAGASWTQTGQGPSAHYFYGTALVASPHNRDVAYVGGSGYEGHPVWRTTNGGIDWEGVGDGLPATLVYGLVIGGENLDMLFAATEAGPYACDLADMQWENIGGTEAPLHLFWCVEWVPEIGVARFGTHCRGIWDYEVPSYAGVDDNENGSEEGAGGDENAPESHPGRPHPDLRLSPNPVSDRLSLQFHSPTAGSQLIELFDLNGRRLLSIAQGDFTAGAHEISVDLSDLRLENGTYFVRRVGSDGTVIRRIQLLR